MTERKFDFRYRQETIEKLSRGNGFYDLLIVGGGITGAGLARDAAMRGLKVLLVEARDFAFGTSSRSSKLIHGGLRYLENLEFKLVFEALRERHRLYRMAPHLVHPLRFVFPVYDFSRVGMFKLACGMWLYDGLSLFKGGSHEQLDRHETLERASLLSSKGLKGAFVYSDAYMDDDRLAIETLRSAFAAGADIINYVSAESIEWHEGRVRAVRCRDGLGREFPVSAHHVVSTVGPWTDEFGKKTMEDWQNILRPSKGVHLTFSRERLAVNDAVVLSDDKNERIVFVIPRNDMVIVGTTDTSYNEDPAEVTALSEDVDYLLQVATEYFPNARLTKSDILATYAGVRPLVKDDEASVGRTSREHTVISDPRGVTFVAGGKYTTYREMAESILDGILDDFPVEKRVALQRCQTIQPLNPLCGEDELSKSRLMAERWARDFNLPQDLVAELVDRHGMEAEKMLKSERNTSLSAEERYWRMEARHAIEQTMCLHLKDFFWRRSHLFLARKNHGIEWLPPLAETFAEHLGWSREQQAEESARVQAEIAKEMSWQAPL